MGLIKYKKAKVEIPDDWIEIFECARQKPFPFDVVKVDKGFFKAWTQHLEQLYAKKSTFPSRPIKELKIQIQVFFFYLEIHIMDHGRKLASQAGEKAKIIQK